MFKNESGQKGAATQEQIKHQAMSAEQGADFRAIQAAAAGAEVQEPAPGQEVAEQGPAKPTAQAMGVAVMVMGVAQPLLCYAVRGLDTAPAQLWDPVTESVAGLLDHYGLARPELQGPWAKLAISVVPLAGMVALARMSEPEPQKQEGQQAIAAPDLSAAPPPAAQGSKVVTFGAQAV